MSFATPHTEQEEVAIDSVEGLMTLLEYATETLAEVKDEGAGADDVDTTALVVKAETAFVSLQRLIEQHARVLSLGGFLSQEDAGEIQALYNQITVVLDSLTRTDEGEAVEHHELPGEQVETPDDFLEEEETDEEDADTNDDESDDVRPTVTSGSLSLQNESTVESVVQIKESTLDSEAIRRQLKLLAGTAAPLIENASRMHQEYEALRSVDADDEDFKNGVFLYTQLEQSLENAKEIAADISKWQQTPTKEGIELFLLHAKQELDEFATNIDSIDQGLLWYFHESEPSATDETDLKEPSKREVDTERLFRPGLFTENSLRSYIDTVVAEPAYQRFLSQRFSSPAEFEAYIQREIDSREAPSQLDKVFGISHKSPFNVLLRDKTIGEVEAFDAQPSETIRPILLDKEIQYETYVRWIHDFSIMKQLVQPQSHMTFGELFIRAMVEDLISLEEMST